MGGKRGALREREIGAVHRKSGGPTSWRSPSKLPVWHREQDLEPAGQYARAAMKISDHHKELL
ncbi:hypothetical protein [Kitasatospora purpeofusca]|uniref:hypothetical protein n=1 Tax=Kitasatospora purpeofusca TaxID=67352 RepID=UPI002A5B08D6|nr:hypothetical protein [Kitasatospora purpeofusca]MDY0811873.1 hypothetical protein [Kitasatospora purpeofusca]